MFKRLFRKEYAYLTVPAGSMLVGDRLIHNGVSYVVTRLFAVRSTHVTIWLKTANPYTIGSEASVDFPRNSTLNVSRKV